MTPTAAPPPATPTDQPASAPVFTPPADPADHARMLKAHAAAARTLHVRAHGPSTLGFKGALSAAEPIRTGG